LCPWRWQPGFFSPDNLKRAKYLLQEALVNAGHWGVPTFVLKNGWIFGDDRIDTLRWRLGERQLSRRQWLQRSSVQSPRSNEQPATTPIFRST
jgi:hypothetical protein